MQERKTILLLIFLLVGCFFADLAKASELEEAESKAVQKSKEWRKEELIEAVNLFAETGKQRVIQNDFKKATDNFLQAGKIFLQLGDKKNALFYFEKSYRLSQQSSLASKQIEGLGELALLEIDSGNILNCRKYLGRAEKISAKSDNPKTSALLLFALSEAYYYRREFSTAIFNLSKAVKLLENTEFSEDKAKYLLNLGYAYIAVDDKDKATSSFYKSLEIFKSIKNVRGEVFTYIALGFAFSNYYEKQKSIDLYKQAENLFVEDVDLDKKAMLYNGLGRVYMDFGEWQYALNYKNKALDLYRKTDNKFGIVATLTSVAVLNTLTNPTDENVNLNNLNSVYKFAEVVKDNFYASILLQETGNYYFRLKDFDNALVYYEKSLPYFLKVKDKREISYIYARTAQILLQKKDFTTARKKLSEALQLNQEIADRISEAETLYSKAKLDLAENKENEGLENIKKSVYLTEVLYSEVANSKLKSTYFSNVFDHYELYINLLMKMHKNSPNENFALQALQAAEKSRARSMLESLSLSEANFTKDANPETVKREKEIRNLLNLKSDKLTDLLSSNADKVEVEKSEGEIRELENELAEINAALKQNSPLYSTIKNPAPFDPAEFQAKVLDDNTLLLEFSFGKEESYLWLIGKKEIHTYILPPRLQIETKIIKLRELIASREVKEGEIIEDYQARIFKADQFYWTEAHELSNELFGQIADKIAGKRLIIVPDGKLHYFPVSALPLPNSETSEPLLFSNETIYEPSASTLLLLSKSPHQNSAAKDLLVFSDPIFTENDSRISAEISNAEPTSLVNLRFAESLNNLPRLAASREEGDAAAAIFSTSKADIFSGFAATREKVLSSATSEYKIVHFATHGLINDERPELSGIVLSGFDEKGGKLEQVVRLQDIYGLNLNADLVVLSACKTGVGKEVRGEGLQSLATGFLNVGAKSVVSSLWKVDDNATKELMTHFYRGLAEEKLTTSEALRRAQIKLAQNPRFKSPFYWAAFTLQGDFQNTPKIATGLGYWIYVALLMPLLLVLIYGIRKFKGTRTSVRKSPAN